mgnify:CR=1 FL=1
MLFRSTGEISVVSDAQPKDLRRARDWIAAHSIVYKLLQQNSAMRKLASAIIPGNRISPVPMDMSMRDPEEYPWLKAAWRKHEANLLEFKAYADSLGASLIFVIIPEMQQIYGRFEPGNKTEGGYYNTRLRGLFESNGIKYLDLLPAFRKYAGEHPEDRLFWEKDRHTSLSGNKVIAREICEYLKKALPRSDRQPAERQSVRYEREDQDQQNAREDNAPHPERVGVI